MATISFNLKLNVNDICFVIVDNKIKKCIVEKISATYKNEMYGTERICKEYTLISADSKDGFLPYGMFNESEVWATKEELIEYINKI